MTAASFIGRSGDCAVCALSTIVMDSDKQCTADFTEPAGTARLTIIVAGNGSVSAEDGLGSTIRSLPAQRALFK